MEMCHINVLVLILLVLHCSAQRHIKPEEYQCHMQHHIFENAPKPSTTKFCPLQIRNFNNSIYLLYNVNPSEGFNLRRDVYIRLAVFVRQLQREKTYFKNLYLVLPPWPRMYHWKSQHLHQEQLPWRMFFDMNSLKRYAPVLDFEEFLYKVSQFGLPDTPFVPVHKVLQLIHFEEMFENGVFSDKFEFAHNCSRKYLQNSLLQQPLLLAMQLECLRFQGTASLLENVLRKVLAPYNKEDPKIIAILNAEIVLHDRWGDREFWSARRSMRFAAPLVEIAAKFRLTHFNSSDTFDRVQRPIMWEMEHRYRGAEGGDYLCAHLRRGDFIYGREKFIPTIRSVALQIKQKLQDLNLTKVFLSTDANAFEKKNLKTHLHHVHVVRFSAESLQQKALIKDGGIAIIDQLVCSNARFFIGTYESTFTYRIYEEREILGFPKRSTFNTFCKNENFQDCAKNSVWPIVY